MPDETTICQFRPRLQKPNLTPQLFALSTAHLTRKGLILKKGSIVDATIIHAPSSTKNKERKRDPEMTSTKKGNTWHFGMKAHVGTDTQGYVHSVAVTTAATHDSAMMEACLHGEEARIYGDKAYVSAERQAAAEARGVEWCVSRKAVRGQGLDEADQGFNQERHCIRARVEHPFGVVKHLWGYRKTRYRGLARNAAPVYTLFALAHFYRARKELARLL